MTRSERSLSFGSAGFTLIELLTTITIVGILSAIASHQFTAYTMRAQDARAESDLRESITADEQTALIRAYNAFERERSPLSLGDDPEKALDEVIRLGKPEAQWTWAQYCEPGTLRDIAICAVKRLSLQTSENSSAT